jgi:hypothetical protein
VSFHSGYTIPQVSMSLARVVSLAVIDLDQIFRLYRQLFNIPAELQQLFQSVHHTYSLLLSTDAALSKRNVGVTLDDYLVRFKQFRNALLDLELFLDPYQVLPRSGPNSDDQGTIEWAGADVTETARFSAAFVGKLKEMDASCESLMLELST